MKPARIVLALVTAVSMILLGLLIAWIIHKAGERRMRAANPKTYCGIFGSLINPHAPEPAGNGSVANGISGLGDMIRLRFEVDSLRQCKDVAKNYCQEAVADGYRVKTLTLVYRGPDPASKEERFTVDPACGLQVLGSE